MQVLRVLGRHQGEPGDPVALQPPQTQPAATHDPAGLARHLNVQVCASYMSCLPAAGASLCLMTPPSATAKGILCAAAWEVSALGSIRPRLHEQALHEQDLLMPMKCVRTCRTHLP